MTKVKSIQKVRFLGQHGQIYNIGHDSFAHNVWKKVTPEQLQHIVSTPKIRFMFDFNPPINFNLLKEKIEIKKGKKSKKKNKEDN